MADETKQEDLGVPEGAVNVDPAPVGDFIKLSEASKDFVKHYGEPDLSTFLVKVGSNSILAKRVVEDLLSEKFGGERSAPTPASESQAPQENNVTGRLDHKGDVPTRIKTGPAADLPPVNA